MKKVLLSGWHIALRDKEQGTWERRQCLLLNYNVKIIFQNKSFDSSVTHILHFLTATINTSNNLRRMILHKHHCTGSCRQQPHESASFSSPRDRWQERSLERLGDLLNFKFTQWMGQSGQKAHTSELQGSVSTATGPPRNTQALKRFPS